MFVSTSRPQEQNEFRVSWKLCLNLWSRKWLRPRRSFLPCSFLPFFRKTFTLEADPKENRQWFCNWRSAHFYHMDSYFIVSMGLIRIQWTYNLYNITRTNFKSWQSFLDSKTCICWDSTIVVYRRTLLTKVIIKQICFFQKIRDKLITY